MFSFLEKDGTVTRNLAFTDFFEKLKSDPDYKVRRIIKQSYVGEICVSTVFLDSFDSYDSFETMVFKGKYDNEYWRCDSKEEALKQHERVLELVEKTRYNLDTGSVEPGEQLI